MANMLFVGDYTPKEVKTFEELAAASTGIHRLGVLRADVDNLGQAFVAGFKNSLEMHAPRGDRNALLATFAQFFFVFRNESPARGRIDFYILLIYIVSIKKERNV